MADKLLKSIKFPTLPDRYVIGDSTLTEEGAAADAKAVGEALATKADTNGRYEDLIVGGAEQLMADEYETDKDPYLFRPTGGSADVGNREYMDKIVGGTVAWNQLVPTLDHFGTEGGVTKTYSAGVATISSTTARNGVYASLNYAKDHKYYISCDLKSASAYSIVLGATSAAYINKSLTADNAWHTISGISNSDQSINGNAYIFAVTTYENLQAKNFVFVDLTQLFGTTIADYIYSLEQSQAGAGVAWFRRYFPEDYYPYDAGTLKSVQTSAHKTYDADGNVIGTYPLDSSLTLRGVPKLVDGKLAFDGDVYPPSGEVQRKFGVVTFDGSSDENIYAGTSVYPFRILLPQDSTTQSVTTEYTNTLANYLTQVRQTDTWGVAMTFSRANGQRYLYFKITDSMTDISELRTYLANHPLVVVYELSTPTTETADGYEQYQICDPSGTEEFVTDSIVPVGHETRYPHDLKKKIETAPDSPSTDGTYLMKRSGGKNTYMALPSTPSANGSYVLTLTVSGGSASYSWTAKE